MKNIRSCSLNAEEAEQEALECEASLGYIIRPCLNNNTIHLIPTHTSDRIAFQAKETLSSETGDKTLPVQGEWMEPSVGRRTQDDVQAGERDRSWQRRLVCFQVWQRVLRRARAWSDITDF